MYGYYIILEEVIWVVDDDRSSVLPDLFPR